VKLKQVIFIVIVLIITCVVAAILYMNSNVSTLREYWKIIIPKEDESIYTVDDFKSYPDTGERYQVLKYTDEKNIENLKSSIEWVEPVDILLEEEAISVINTLGVGSEYYPDFTLDYIYYEHKKEDFGKLMMFYFLDENILYIVENL
jgi:hypothetical protein